MIDLIFYLETEIVMVRIIGNNITFSTSNFGNLTAPIENLKLSYSGVCREFPDLELRDDWKEEAIKRFKDKVNNMKSEEEIAEYIISDLRGHGYVPKWKQKNGFRREKI